ncbi:MAG: hypothetical protein ACLP9L_16640 [Thermoguttaceae bacterium]
MKLFLAIVATQVVAILMCGFGWLVPPLPWTIVGWVWAYNLVWMVAQDIAKLVIYRVLDSCGAGPLSFVETLRRPLHSHAGVRHRN